MARIRRIVIPNNPHYITQRGVRSMNIFFKDEDYKNKKQEDKKKRKSLISILSPDFTDLNVIKDLI